MGKSYVSWIRHCHSEYRRRLQAFSFTVSGITAYTMCCIAVNKAAKAVVKDDRLSAIVYRDNAERPFKEVLSCASICKGNVICIVYDVRNNT